VTSAEEIDIRDTVRAELLGPGGLFEVAEESVRGRDHLVFVNRKRSLREMVEAAAERGETEFLVLGDQRVTYDEFVGQVGAVAAWLSDRGVGAGDRVAILAANRPEWIVTFFGAASMGAIVTALNGWWTAHELAAALDLTTPRVLIGDRRLMARVPVDHRPATLVEIESSFGDLIAKPGPLPDVPISEDDAALILFTSGTTGRPKGATISHRGLIGFVQSMIYNGAERVFVQARLGKDSVPPGQLITLATSPLFHVSGLFGSTLMAVEIGGKLVFREGRFDPADVLRLLEQERVTSWSAIGGMGPKVLDCPDLASRDLSSVTNLGFGGAPVGPELQDRLRDAFANAASAMGMGYGSSESVAVATSIGGEDFIERPTSCGTANVGFEVEVRGPDGVVLPDGLDGEVFVRSAYTMLGYWNDPEATSEVLDVDGWLAMGDIGHFDAGWLHLNSRARDMIVRSAENVHPFEIEYRLDAHPDVVESAVVGVDHPELGQEVKAVVVTRPGIELAPATLSAWVGETLAAFKVPSLWAIGTEPLPRNAAGKIVKRALVEAVEDGLSHPDPV